MSSSIEGEKGRTMSIRTRVQCTAGLALVAAFCLIQQLAATTLVHFEDEDLVKNAELIFQGVVTRIDYKMSGFRNDSDARFPHTFVTFLVERIFKGNHTGRSGQLTLRFLGG